ncbi:ABC transporter substrate-binding protein [Streptomyces sp. LZ34]
MTRDHTAETASPTATTFLSRRGFLGALGGGLAATTLAACGSGGGGGGSEIVFMNQSRGQAATLAQLAEEYTRKTGVKIRIDDAGPADFPTKLQSSSQSGDMPDIYSALDANSMAAYYKAGWAMDLSSRMRSGWDDTFIPAVVKLSTFAKDNPQGVDPGVYSAHWEVQDYGLLANPAMFKKAGLSLDDPPATTADLIDQFSKIKKAGADPFWVAASLVPQLVQTLVSNWLTDAEIDSTFAGKSSWKNDAWRKSLQFLADLRDAGVIATGSLASGTSDNPTVEKAFFNTQNVAAIFDASVGVGVGTKTAPDFTDFRSLVIPKAPDGTLTPRPAGGVGRGAAINPKSKRAAEALKFVRWLTETAQDRVFMDKVPLIPSNHAALQGKVSPKIAGFAANAARIQIVPTTMKAQVLEALVQGAAALVLKERTVDQVLKDLDAAQRSS